jgi:Flp pilus assembly protein TadG
MWTIARLAELISSRKGNVGVIFALASPVVIGGAAFSVETSYWYFKQHQLQGAADNAAFAASLENRNGSSIDVIDAAASKVAGQNGFDASTGTITVQTPPTSGAYAGDGSAVSVTLTQPQKRFFTQLFSNAPVMITVNATAVYHSASSACILALDPGASGAAYFSGSSALSLKGCVVMADSLASDAVNVWGSSTLSTDCVVSGGGVTSNGGLTETACTAPVTNAAPAPDPFKKLPAPSTAGPCASTGGSTLQPGVYCNGLSLKGDVTLAPGVYVIENSLSINAQAHVVGNGVTIYLASGASLSMNGNATVDLSAPTSGTYSGILFFGDRASSGATYSFNGTADSVMTGALYFPTETVSYNGDFAGANGCTQIVADKVAWSGNASFNVNCSGYGMSPIPALQAVKLVS